MGEQRGVREPVRLPPLLMTKLHPPPRREQTVARDRVVGLLRARPGIKLTVVAAPAGCGKTTLLGAWSELEETAKPIAWVSLDEGRQRPGRAVVVRARGAPRCLSDTRSGLVAGGARTRANRGGVPAGADQRVGEQSVMPRWSSTISIGSRAARRATASRGSSTALPRRSSSCSRRATSRLCLWARCARTGRWSRSGRVTSASPPTRQTLLLNDRLELGLERADVEDLVERTEGWPAGIYLAALSLQAAEDRHRAS